MNEPTRLLQMPQLARRLGVCYSVIYKAFTAGELSAAFALLNGSPLFEEDKLEQALDCLKKRFSAEDFFELKGRLSIRTLESKGLAKDVIDERQPVGFLEARESERMRNLALAADESQQRHSR
jgi:hypothetical protein